MNKVQTAFNKVIEDACRHVTWEPKLWST